MGYMSDWTDRAAWPRGFALALLVFLVYPGLELARGGLTVPRAAPAAAVAAVVLGVYAGVCWRQPAPGRALWAVLAGMAVVAALVPLLWGPGWLGLLLYPAVAAGLLVPGTGGLAAVAGLSAAIAAIGFGAGAEGDAVLSISLVTLLAGLAAAGIARLIRLTRELRFARAQVARLAAADERLRLAAELHDAVKQHLFVASLELGASRAGLGAGIPASHLERAEQAVAEAKAGLAGLISGLRRAGPAGAGGPDLGTALRSCLAAWQERHQITVRFCGPGSFRCPPEVQEAVLSAVQEALTNVARHARAATVAVTAESGDDAVRVTVADDGTGFQPGRAPGGHGLSIMAERLARAGGRAAVTSAPGDGTTVTLSWPAGNTGPVRP